MGPSEPIDQATAARGSPQLRIFGTRGASPTKIPPSTWRLYEELLPVAEERDDPANIVIWLNNAFQHPNDAWANIFATLTEGDECIGLGFLSIYRPLNWGFWSYLAVKPDRRGQGKAERIVYNMLKKCDEIAPGLLGILFAIESVDLTCLDELINHIEATRFQSRIDNLSLNFRECLDRVKRLSLFTFSGVGPKNIGSGARRSRTALPLMMHTNAGSRPFPYRQPALKTPLNRSSEADLWLMVYPMAGLLQKAQLVASSVSPSVFQFDQDEVEAIIAFLYLHLFPSGYDKNYTHGTAIETAIHGYNEYVTLIFHDVTRAVGQNRVTAERGIVFSQRVRRLLTLWAGFDAA